MELHPNIVETNHFLTLLSNYDYTQQQQRVQSLLNELNLPLNAPSPSSSSAGRFTIRAMVPEDIPAVAHIMNQFGEHGLYFFFSIFL